MSLSALSGRLRRMAGSVFVKCAAIMALTTMLVAVVLVFLLTSMTDRIAVQAVRSSVETAVLSKAKDVAKPLRFGVVDQVEAALVQAVESLGAAGRAAIVVDADGSVVAQSSELADEEQQRLAAHGMRVLEEGGAAEAGSDTVFAAPVVVEAGAQPIGVVVMQWSSQATLAQVNAEQSRAMLYGAGIFLVMMMITIALLQRIVGRPLARLGATITGIAEGDYDPDAPMQGRGDEFGAISRNLQNMIEALRAARRAEEERAADAEAQRVVVDHLSGGLQAMAEGRLSHRIETAFSPRYEQLRVNYNQAIASLADALTDVTASAQNINRGAGEIGRASEDLSHRTETQAATLEQTAAALDQLVASVKSAASSATEVDGIVKDASALVDQNAAIMQNAVAAMAGIEKSSDQIGDIISVIDDIAFQTNLLALNAGVEAARAGTAGKGFAVVASEVRALAQRSSDAAQQIKALISGSTQQVKTGAQLVEQAGSALNEVVERVQHISGLVGTIAHGATEQSQGLHEINLGVTNLDQVTQQNAAMVEQSTAAAQMLGSDADTLIQLVGRFTLETGPLQTLQMLNPRAA